MVAWWPRSNVECLTSCRISQTSCAIITDHKEGGHQLVIIQESYEVRLQTLSIMRTVAFALICIVCISQLLLCQSFSTLPQSAFRPKQNDASRRPTCLLEGYVPDGLSPEEYSKIKKEEAARLKSKDYGRFGPRFLKASRPGGDWFLNQSLWTGGFDSNRRMSNNNNDGNESLFVRIKRFFQQWWPAMFLSYLVIDVGMTMEAASRTAQMKPRQLISMFIKVFIWAKRQNMWLVWWKAQTVKCALTLALTNPVQKYLDYAETKWKWSRRRTVVATSSVMIGGSLAWSLLLLALKHFHLTGA